MGRFEVAVRKIVRRSPRVFGGKLPENEQPLRSEHFSPEQMQRHGKSLAESHAISDLPSRNDTLLARLVENETFLTQVLARLNEAALAKQRILPAAEWLLDNFYLVEEHIHISKRDLPKGYSRRLPRLRDSHSEGFPRVYDIALERISHGDGIVEPETFQDFLHAYQSVTPLTLGEPWAIPIMLRLALIENLRRVAAGIVVEMHAQNNAISWAGRMTESAESDPKS